MPPLPVRFGLVAVLALALPMTSVACKRATPIEKVRDALTANEALDDVTKEIPSCTPPLKAPPPEGCLVEIANALGSKSGFSVTPPDQASAAAVGLLLVRERRGDWAPLADTWLEVMKVGKGAGADVLRLAVAKAMADAAPLVSKDIQEEADAVAFFKAIATAIPGACATYAALGDGVSEDKMPPEMSPDHEPCVHKDLKRKEGPGGKYGVGLWRAAAAAMALWKDELAALKAGAPLMEGKPKSALEARIAALEAATAKNGLKKSAPRVNEQLAKGVAEAHAGALHGADAGGDAGADAGGGAGRDAGKSGGKK